MRRHVFHLALTLRSPFLFRGLQAGPFGLDATQMRDEDQRPILPADQARGVLKESLVDIAAAAPAVVTREEIHALFGLGSDTRDGEQDRPERGLVTVSDLSLPSGRTLPALGTEIVRVEIDDATGAARTGRLQFIEGVAPVGEELTFAGHLVVYWAPETIERLVAALGKAVATIQAVGAFKSVGFGRVVRGDVRLLAEPAPASPAADPVRRRGFALRFDRPYLVDADRVVDNAFVGSAIVPGAVIKGALARKIELIHGPEGLERLGPALSALVISHAFPEDSAGRPGGEPIPLSTVARRLPGGPILLGDDLRLDGNIDASGPFLAGKPAAFPSDWKESWRSEIEAQLGRAPYTVPSLLPRTRTRIDEETGAAFESALFTTVACSPLGSDGTQRRFLFTLDRGAAPVAEAAEIVAILRGGLDFVGKTDATITLEPWQDGDTAPPPRPVQGNPDLFAVVLRTPAVLVDPRTEDTAAQAYATYWRAAAGAELVDFCASQSLAGGYLATRRRPWPGTYHPFVLTAAGSVFLLRGDLSGRLAELIRSGLEPPAFAGAVPLDWRSCPFVPGNGYGEIRAEHLSGHDVERIGRVERTRHA